MAFVGALAISTILAPAAFATATLSPVPGSPFATGAAGEPIGVAFSPKGGLLANTNLGGTLSVFSVSSAGRLTPVSGSPFATGQRPFGVAFNPSGTLVATGNQTNGSDAVSVFSVGSAGRLTPVPGSPFSTGGEPYAPDAVAFSPSGTLLATSDGGYGMDGHSVSVFSVAPNGVLTQIPGSPFTVSGLPYGLAFSPSGNLLAIGSYSKTGGPGLVTVFSVGAAGQLTQVSGSPFSVGPGAGPPAFSPNGQLLAEPDYAGLNMFSVGSSGRLSPVAGSPFNFPNIGDVAFSPTGDRLATANSVPDGMSDQVSVFTVSAAGVPTKAQSSPNGAANGATILSYSPTAGLLATTDGSNNKVSVFSGGSSTPTGKPGTGTAHVGSVKTSGTTAKVSVSCAKGGPSCTVTAEITATEKLKGQKVIGVSAIALANGKRKHKKSKTRKKVVVLGKVKVTIAAGQKKTIKVSLNGAGKKLLAKHKHLKTKLQITSKIAGGKTKTVANKTVTFKKATKKKHKKK